MPLTQRREYRVPDFWSVFGHSFMQYSFGTFYQSGRADSIVRAMLDIEHTNWQNYAINGARACIESSYTGGFHRMFQKSKKPQRGGPYVADGGAALFCYGINDIGMVDNTTQVKDAFIHAMRSMISRWRASVIFENNYQVGTRTSYGAGFGSIGTTGYTSNDNAHWCIDTTPDADDFFTLTLPSDYDGEPVAICLVGAGGAAGGTVTWSGTAGVTGTTDCSNIMPTSAVSHCPVIKRVTNLTSANAGQTIVGTVTAMDSGGAVMLDCWWLEAKEPPPVIVCDITRLPASGYTSNYPSWDGTEGSRDQDVLDWNTALYSLVAEFDSMVQIAYVDDVIQKNTSYFFTDALHPNERGAARIADAIGEAIKRLEPVSTSVTASLNPSSPRAGGSLRPRRSGLWYTMDYATTTTYTPVAGHLYAFPIWVTQGREFWNQLSLECSTAGSSQTTIRWGLYEDVGWSGYPGDLINEATAAGVFSITNSTGVKTSPTSGDGSINWVLDPGLYWIGFKVISVGTSQVLRALQGHNNAVMPNCGTTGLPLTQANSTNSWRLTGQGASELPTTFPTGGVATASCPFVGVKVFINPTN